MRNTSRHWYRSSSSWRAAASAPWNPGNSDTRGRSTNCGKGRRDGSDGHSQPPLRDLPLGWMHVLQDSPRAAGINYPSTINSPSSTDIPNPIDITIICHPQKPPYPLPC